MMNLDINYVNLVTLHPTSLTFRIENRFKKSVLTYGSVVEFGEYT